VTIVMHCNLRPLFYDVAPVVPVFNYLGGP